MKARTYYISSPCLWFCFLFFVFRHFSDRWLNKISDTGWLFVLSMILTASIGLFYTFSLTPFFILGFSCSVVSLPIVMYRIYRVRPVARHMAFILFATSIWMVISGLYVDNHIAFALAIRIPENVLALSARQALIKETASIATITIIISGILFLNRRKWNPSGQ